MAQKRQTQQPILAKFQQVGSTQITQIQQRDEEIAELRQQLETLQRTPHQTGGILMYPIQEFVPLRLRDGLAQPRKYFDPKTMEQLKKSIEKVGVQEPLLVRRGLDGKLEIVSGERRWRCGKELQLSKLPVIERNLDDEHALEIALVANLIRDDLNMVEETDSIIALISLRLQIPLKQLSPTLIKVKNLRHRHQKSNTEIVQELRNVNSDYSGIITEASLSHVDTILSEFGIGLESFVTNRLIALKKMPASLLEAVRKGAIAFSKADVIRRSNLPESEQETILQQAISKKLTKADLMETVRAVKAASIIQAEQRESDLKNKIYERHRKIRQPKNWKKIETDAKLKRKMQHVEQILGEVIDALEGEE